MTGLVYVAIVALWAAVLIPMWLRRHDDDQARRLDRHRSAMGTLATISAPRTSAAREASRRRRTLLALLAVPAVLAVGAWLLGLIPTAFMVLGVIPVAVYGPLATLAARRSATRAAAAQPIADADDLGEEVAVDEVGADEETADAVSDLGRHAAPVADPEPVVQPTPERHRRVAMASWDEVFDQSA